MSVEGVTYTISGCWKDDMEHPDEIAARFVALLDRIASVIPVKTDWLLCDFADVDIHAGPYAEPPVNFLLADIRKDMAAFVERNDIKDEDGSSDPRNGYLLIARGSEDGSEVASSRSIDVTATAGSRWDNDVKFEVGSLHRPADPALTTYPVYKGSLEAMISAFPCPFAWAKYDVFTKAVWIRQPGGSFAAPEEPVLPFDGVWIAYLSAPLAAGLTAPSDLYPERTPGGGLILAAVKDRIDPTNPDHLRRSIRLRDIMAKQIAGSADRAGFSFHDFPPRVGPY